MERPHHQQQQNGFIHHTNHQQHVPHDSAMSVGSSTSGDAERILELEDEVRMLAEKANAASQRYADYENEIRTLESRLKQEQRKNSLAPDSSTTNTATIAAVAAAAAAPAAASRPGISRFNSFMSTRKATPPTVVTPNGTPSSSQTLSPIDRQKELEEQLAKEQTARLAAEQKAKQVSAEIEDLSATLFQQANEMVATERKQNSALQEKVQALERSRSNGAGEYGPVRSPGSDMAALALQNENARLREKLRTMEVREAQRVKRLERLEAATKRVERVRAMLKPP